MSPCLILAAAIIMPATGWLEARFGRKSLFLTSVIGFIVTSMLCGTAVSLAQIVVFCSFWAGVPSGRWPDGSTGSDLRRSVSALGRCSCSSTAASGSTGSPRPKSGSRPRSACSGSTCSRSTPCRRAIRSSIPRCSVTGIS
jgi:MFS family permease